MNARSLFDAASAVMSFAETRSSADDERVHSAGDRYLAIIAPVNEVVAMFNAATDDSLKARVIQALSLVLDFTTTEIESVDWPAEARGEVRQLVVAATAASTAATALVSDLTDEAAAVFASEVATLTVASSNVRAVLGLPIPR